MEDVEVVGIMEPLDPGALGNLMLSALSLALILAVLIGIADTRLYPLALAAVILALVYYVLHHPSIAKTWDNLIVGAANHLK